MSHAPLASTESSHPRRARWLLAASGVGLVVATAGIATGSELVSTWFYDLCWWSYILLADAFVHLRTGRSLLLSRPRAFCLLAVWSAAFWLSFELANLRLSNWYYVGIPPDVFSRGPGVFLSFATVLPGLAETAAWLAAVGFARRLESRPWKLGPRSRAALTALGWLSIALPLAWPRWFYWMIWGAPLFLFEPWLHARGERSFLRALSAGDPRPCARWLAAGAVCGALWESWNHWATAKWIYTVPFFDDTKLFEMPLLGFVGFLPFALSSYTTVRALVAVGWLPEFELDLADRGAVSPRRHVAIAGVALALSVPAIVLVNRVTLRATAPRVAEIPGIRTEIADDARRAGLEFVRPWMRALRGPDGARHARGATAEELAAWTAAAELMQVRGLGARGLAWLSSVGVRTVDDLAARDAEELERALRSGRGPAPVPSAAEIRVWVRGARRTRGRASA